VLARLAGTLPKPLITACPEGPSVLLLNLSSETRKPPSSKHRHLAHKQHSATPPDQQSFCCCCCCSSSAFRISLSDRRTTPSARPTTPGDLVSAVYLPIYHCPRRPRAGCKETLDGPSPPRRPLLRALHSPPSLLLPVVRAHLPTTCMSSPPVAYTPSTPHIRLNSGSDDLVNMADNQNDHAVRPMPSSRSLTRPGTAGSASVRPSLHPAPSSNSMYNAGAPESAELLLPPSRSRPSRRFRDDDSPMRSPSQSGYNSRRTSWGSESTGSRDSRAGPFASPFDDSRAPSRAGSDDEGVNTQTVSEKYNILPSAGLLLFPEDVEKDDYLHNPDPNEKEGRITCSDLFSKRGITNLGGLVLITLGVFMLFIGYPIMYVLDSTASCHLHH
jgi:hypothetical protein